MRGEGWRCWSNAAQLQAILAEQDGVWEMQAFCCNDEDCTENVPAGNRCSRQRCGCACHHVVVSNEEGGTITGVSLKRGPVSHPQVEQLMRIPRDQRPLMSAELYEHYGAIRRARGLLMGELFRLRDRSNWDIHNAAIETAHISEIASTETVDQEYHGAVDGETGVEVPPASVIAQGPRLAGYTLKVPMYIYNNKEVLAMLDTGADTCLVSKSILTKSSLAHVREMQHRMVTVNGEDKVVHAAPIYVKATKEHQYGVWVWAIVTNGPLPFRGVDIIVDFMTFKLLFNNIHTTHDPHDYCVEVRTDAQLLEAVQCYRKAPVTTAPYSIDRYYEAVNIQ